MVLKEKKVKTFLCFLEESIIVYDIKFLSIFHLHEFIRLTSFIFHRKALTCFLLALYTSFLRSDISIIHSSIIFTEKENFLLPFSHFQLLVYLISSLSHSLTSHYNVKSIKYSQKAFKSKKYLR